MAGIEVREARTEAEVARLFPVMKELRPHLSDANELAVRVGRQAKESGYRLIFVEDAGQPVAAAGFRISEWLAWGKALYVDDLIALESHRGKGFAEALMDFMEKVAIAEGCSQFHLDSGTHRERAHHFYFRQGLSITSFHFQKSL